MSDTIIRKVIIGILIMLMVLPLITYAGIDYTMEYGLDKIFWFGRSNCNTIGGDFYCTRDNWLTQDGWNEILYFFSDSTKINENDNKATNLLWLYAPDYSQNGKMAEITSIQRNDEQVWKQNDECAGFKISNKNCKYRTDELEVVSFIPQICQKEWKDDCKYLVSYARYSIRDAVVNEAILQFATTVFTCLIISVASLLFASDTQNIIVKPITKVVKIILRFVDDPLQQPDPPNTFEDDLKDSTSKYLKTTELEKIIYRIGTLLQMSFGHLGANIIRENVVLLATTKNDNSLEIMKAGRRIDAIFMVCSINYYSSILETLKENSVVYINKVAKIVHQ